MEGSEISIIMSSPGSKFKLTNDFFKVPSFLQMDAGLLFRDEPNIS
jgi:hypothetical protein